MLSADRGEDRGVAVTGIGMITALGLDTRTCWDRMLRGESAVRRITKFDPGSCRTQIGAQLPDEYFDLERKEIPKRLRKMTVRATRLIRLCARQAMSERGLDPDDLPAERCAAIIGTSGSSIRGPEDQETKATAKFRIIREMVNAMPAWISLDYGFKGPTYTVSAGECSGLVAICMGWDLIVRGEVDLVLAGGVDNLLTASNVAKWNAQGLLSVANDPPEKAVKPFDRRRDGYVLGDGGCALVLESRRHAQRTGASVYAHIHGHAMAADAYRLHGCRPDGESLARAIEIAIGKAGLSPERIGHICAQGDATVAHDLYEAQAIRRAFGGRVDGVLVNSHKAMIGHTIGAAGALQVAVAALALRHQQLPPTLNLEDPDPACELNFVTGNATSVDIGAALTTCFTTGGHSHAVVIGARG